MPDAAQNPIGNEQTITPEAFQAWLDQARLYALIDGLGLPDLPGQVSRRHPDAEVALYHGPFGELHEAETPRFVRLDAALLEWLQPTIDADPGWGWCLVLRDDLAGLPTDATLKLLTDHFRPLVWMPQKDGHWLFRLHDPRVLRNWLLCATPKHIAAFMAPLAHILFIRPDNIRVITPRPAEPPLGITPLPPAPWPDATLQAMLQIGQQDRLDRLAAHLREQHPGVQNWPDDKLNQYTLQNANQAWRYGFYNEQAIAQYLSLCAVMGADFTTRTDGDWARAILQAPDIIDSQNRITRLVEAALQQLADKQTKPTQGKTMP